MPARLRPGPWTAAAVLVLLAAAAHAAVGWGIASPWIASDEPTYGMLGRSLWDSGGLRILGHDSPFYSLVYPAITGLPLTVFDTVTGIHVLQVVQPLVMAAAGLAAFAWARRLVTPWLALLAAALTVATPALTYSGLMMTEVAYYPIATVALLSIGLAVEDPTLERQAFAVATILLASLTRLQGLVLLPVLFTAVLLAAVFERSPRLLRRFALALGLLAVTGVVFLVLRESGNSGDMLGAYSATTEGSYRVGAALEWIVWHAGALFLLVAGLPLIAAGILAVDAVRGRERDPAARALIAVATAYAVWSVLQVGVFASRFSGTLLERNLITVAPPLFVCFALWLHRGAPRPRPAAWLVTGVLVAPALAVPPDRLTDPAAAPQSLTALAFGHIRGWSSLDWTRGAWIGAVLVLALGLLLVPRRRAALLGAVVLACLCGASALAASDARTLAANLRWGLYDTSDPAWVDASANGPVTYLFDGSQYWNGVWIRSFWNTRITRVITLPGPQPGALPPHDTVSPRFDGELFDAGGRPVTTPYLLASSRLDFAGTIVHQVAQPVDGTVLTLWRLDGPARLSMIRSGFKGNGDFSGQAQIDVFDCRPGKLGVTLVGKDGSPVTLSAAGVEPRTVNPKTTEGTYVLVPTPPGTSEGSHCTFALYTPGLAGTTVIRFVPDG